MLKKLAKLSPGVKASISFFVASLITKGISFITTPIFTRLLTSEQFGQVSVYYTWMQLFGIVAMFCLSYGVFNVGLLDNPDKRDEFSFSLLILSNIITVCFAGIIFCLYPFIKDFLELTIPMLILMIIFFLFQPAYVFWTVRQRFEYKYKWQFLWSCVTALVSVIVPVLLIVFSKNPDNNLYYRIFGAEISLILIYIGFYIYLIVKAKGKLNIKYWKSVFLFNLPLIPHYLSMYILNSSDKLMISYLINDSATAFYAVAYSIASIVIIIWSSIDASLMPFTFQKLKAGDYDSIKRVTAPVLLVFALGSFIVMMLGPEIVKLMGTSDYLEAAYVIPPVVGGIFFQIQYFLYSNVIYYYKKPHFVLIGSIGAALLNVVLNYFCIKQFGYIAAAYTTLVCYFVQAVVDFIAMRIVSKRKIYDLKYIVGLSAIVTTAAIFSGLLYDTTFPRYGIIGISILFLFTFGSKIKSTLLEIKKGDKNG